MLDLKKIKGNFIIDASPQISTINLKGTSAIQYLVLTAHQRIF